MADVVLFHHVLGLSAGVVALAEEIAAAGHRVTTPDLFDGRRFSAIADGAAYVDGVEVAEIVARGERAVAGLASDLVYVGISLGVMAAQSLAQTRSGAAGAVLLEAFAPPEFFGDGWPPDVPLQVHGMADDEFFAGEGDLDAARGVVESMGDSAELFVYPGNAHLFTDRSLPAHDPVAERIVVERLLAFLERA